MESKRINKYLSEVGFCSRRKADEYISIGRVYINGKVAELGSKVNMNDEIKVDGEIIQNTNKKRVYIAFNKPVGIECTGNPKVKDNIIDFINHKERLFTIGRIDKQSEGLILLTNNGDIVNNVLRAENKKEKEYIVWVNKNITQDFIEKMRKGVRIMGKMTKRCYVKRINDNRFKNSKFENYLSTKNIPDPDILIRTGGFNRLSDFMIYQSSFTELFFTKKLWPDLKNNDLSKIFHKYLNTERKFGL